MKFEEKYITNKTKKYPRGFFNKELNFTLSSSSLSFPKSLNNNFEIGEKCNLELKKKMEYFVFPGGLKNII